MSTKESGKLRSKIQLLSLQLMRTWDAEKRAEIQAKIEELNAQLKSSPRHDDRVLVAQTEDNWLKRWFKNK